MHALLPSAISRERTPLLRRACLRRRATIEPDTYIIEWRGVPNTTDESTNACIFYNVRRRILLQSLRHIILYKSKYIKATVSGMFLNDRPVRTLLHSGKENHTRLGPPHQPTALHAFQPCTVQHETAIQWIHLVQVPNNEHRDSQQTPC